ncbi:unnamed protein product [Parnassius mnemosyne]|uniref:Uncharacterized protein n=1 Tax=Parnassius mnemosyne TaxID=213953 RepID=A0AAV1LJW7_9NEOP
MYGMICNSVQCEGPAVPLRSASLRLSAEQLVSLANGGATTASGALHHYLAAACPRPRPPHAPPPAPPAPPACDCLPHHPIPPPENFHF